MIAILHLHFDSLHHFLHSNHQKHSPHCNKIKFQSSKIVDTIYEARVSPKTINTLQSRNVTCLLELAPLLADAPEFFPLIMFNILFDLLIGNFSFTSDRLESPSVPPVVLPCIQACVSFMIQQQQKKSKQVLLEEKCEELTEATVIPFGECIA